MAAIFGELGYRLKPDLSAGVSLLAKDLQGTALIYNQQGELASAVRIGQTVAIYNANSKAQFKAS